MWRGVLSDAFLKVWAMVWGVGGRTQGGDRMGRNQGNIGPALLRCKLLLFSCSPHFLTHSFSGALSQDASSGRH